MSNVDEQKNTPDIVERSAKFFFTGVFALFLSWMSDGMGDPLVIEEKKNKKDNRDTHV